MNFGLLAVFFIPWVLDLIGGRAVMATLFGSLLWGTGVVLYASISQIKDQKLKKILLLGIWALGGAWFSYWIMAFSNEPAHHLWLGKPLRWLVWTHAGLLSAGAAFVGVGAIFSFFWLLAERRVHKGSWQRRKVQFKLPSLEASSKVTSRALILGWFAWTFGLLLASTNGFIQWSQGLGDFADSASRWAWASDSKFIVASVLWVILSAAIVFYEKVLRSKSKFLFALLLSIVFTLGFYCLLTLESSTRHMPVRWFVE